MRKVTIQVDDGEVTVDAGTTVAAAVLKTGSSLRTSVAGNRRAALCGMGTCFECRVRFDGRPHQRACLVVARNGMVVHTR
jgi:predicted molibdopterin-dependent oxidoreductase YjgC